MPGQSVGLLSLGDTRDLALKIFPPKENIDSEYSYTFCGPRSEIFWLDINLKNQKAAGYVSIFLRDGRIFQIESATPRFRTREGITEDTHPEKVKQHYKELKAYFLWRSGGEEVGGRDLIYWVSQEKGIAFELYYNRKVGHRLIYKVIVFEAGSQFFPEGCIVPPREWHELPPYTLELEGYPPPRMPRPARSPIQHLR